MAIPAQEKWANVPKKRRGNQQAEYDKHPRHGKTGTRSIRMSNNKIFGTKNAYVKLDWDPEGIAADLEAAITEALEPIMRKMADRAKSLVQTGGNSPGAVEEYTWKRKDGSVGTGTRFNPRDRRAPYQNGPHRGEFYTSREPGRLKESIRHSVHTRNDRTAILGFLEAGDENTDYAFWEELGVPGVVGGKREGHAFIRPAFNEFADEAVRAIEKAVASL